MSETTEIVATVNANPEGVQQEQRTEAPALVEAPEAPEAPDPKEAKKLEKESSRMIREAVKAFASGSRKLLASRVKAGEWCAAFYQWREAHGYKDREFSSKMLFNALVIHADSAKECDPSMLAKLYQTVELLAPRDEGGAVDACWEESGMTLGKLEALSGLTFRANGTETYAILMREREGDAKALFRLGCEEGEKRIGRDELALRVLKIVNPEKAKAKEEAKAAKAPEVPPEEAEEQAATVADDDEEDSEGTEAQDDGKGATDQRGTVTGNLLNPETAYTAKDAAELALGILAKSEAPDTALEELLRGAAENVELSAGTRRVCKMVVLWLARKASPAPAEVAKALAEMEAPNGATVAVSA